MDSDSIDNINSEGDTSNDEEHLSDQGPELESEEESVESDVEDEDDLDASATESDEDELDIIEEKKNGAEESRGEKVKIAIYQRYEERHGKQLYIRFPHKVPETQEALEQKVKELIPLAIKAHKPRQRHARFCLIDFADKEDRDAALNVLKKSIKKGELKKFAVSIPRTESSDFVQELAERKIKSIENKKAKLRLKKASKKALTENNFTSTVVVLNLPKNASSLQVRELFTNAVDINIKPGKGKVSKDTSFAAVTFPTTHDARNAIKKKVSLGGNQLIIKFDNKKFTKKTKSKKTFKNDETNQQSEPVKESPKSETSLDRKRKIPTKTSAPKAKSKNGPKSGPAIKRIKLQPTIDDTVTKISSKSSAQKPELKKTNNVKKNNAGKNKTRILTK